MTLSRATVESRAEESRVRISNLRDYSTIDQFDLMELLALFDRRLAAMEQEILSMQQGPFKTK